MARFSPGRSSWHGNGCGDLGRKCLLLLAAWLIFLAGLIVHFGSDSGAPSIKGHERDGFFLVAVIFNRVFAADLFNITSFECRQWIDYMGSAGVEHIYWYDTAHDESESQEESLRPYVESGALTYHRFYSLFPKLEGSDFHYEQDNSYAHFLANYNRSGGWAIEMDVDEYPFSPTDTNPGFLARFLRRTGTSEVSQILLQCMLFMGNPMGDPGNWVIERYQRRKRESEGTIPGFHSRQKPIFRPALTEGVTTFDPHKFVMRIGATIVAEEKEMRMNHYWGPRLTDFGPDTPEAVAMLVEDSGIQPIASYLKRTKIGDDLRYGNGRPRLGPLPF
ncbi:hypothetical protein SELMODRAFT_422639 [Selaginella moellendorffii]|uniref:Glycosyltransferase family 92 protein n=1 Tax=Selaginella moellendorffii TaxID=88036 RepID=D8SJ25_SELML|nr:hypothetical protein SELMODRAFT_422639 [Selaginella moellendorffii]